MAMLLEFVDYEPGKGKYLKIPGTGDSPEDGDRSYMFLGAISGEI